MFYVFQVSGSSSHGTRREQEHNEQIDSKMLLLYFPCFNLYVDIYCSWEVKVLIIVEFRTC